MEPWDYDDELDGREQMPDDGWPRDPDAEAFDSHEWND